MQSTNIILKRYKVNPTLNPFLNIFRTLRIDLRINSSVPLSLFIIDIIYKSILIFENISIDIF